MNLADKAYEIIRDEIVTCVLEPGQQIAQSQLSQKYKLGLTPVREALQRLAQEGLVQSIPRFGYTVSPITFADIRILYEYRSILERSAIRMAIERASDAELEEIAASAQFTYTFGNAQSYVEFLNRNVAFHRSIATATGNPRLVSAISGLLLESNRMFYMGLELGDNAGEMVDEHLALARALRARDADAAERLFEAQNARSEERVRQALMGEGRKRSSVNAFDQSIRVSRVTRS